MTNAVLDAPPPTHLGDDDNRGDPRPFACVFCQQPANHRVLVDHEADTQFPRGGWPVCTVDLATYMLIFKTTMGRWPVVHSYNRREAMHAGMRSRQWERDALMKLDVARMISAALGTSEMSDNSSSESSRE